MTDSKRKTNLNQVGSNLSDHEVYISVEQEEGPGPCKSVEGYIVFCSGLHEEAQEEQIYDLFADYGNIKSLHVNLDRKTGFLKGYAFIEFENLVDAQKSVNKLNGSNFLDKKINVGFAFKKPERKGVKK